MTDELDRHAATALARFKRINAFVVASIQRAREFRETLEGRAELEDAAPVTEQLRTLSAELSDWLVRAKHLRAWLLEMSREVGVTVEKARLGAIEGGVDEVRRLGQTLDRKHRTVVVAFIEAGGRDLYHETLELADDLLEEDTSLDATDEFRQLREELDTDVEDILRRDAREDDIAVAAPTTSVTNASE